MAISRVREAGPQNGRRGQIRREKAELALTTPLLRRTISALLVSESGPKIWISAQL